MMLRKVAKFVRDIFYLYLFRLFLCEIARAFPTAVLAFESFRNIYMYRVCTKPASIVLITRASIASNIWALTYCLQQNTNNAFMINALTTAYTCNATSSKAP